jgi:hypothetical protein
MEEHGEKKLRHKNCVICILHKYYYRNLIKNHQRSFKSYVQMNDIKFASENLK